jgi:hypothetical protein
MLINKFKFRRDIEAYHLGGMGCSVGVVGIGLVRDMLAVRPGAVSGSALTGFDRCDRASVWASGGRYTACPFSNTAARLRRSSGP